MKIPPEINPLTSLQLISSKAEPILPKRYSSKLSSLDDWDSYEAATRKKSGSSSSSSSRISNHGKKWSAEDENDLQHLFSDGTAIKDIAKQLSRGINGIRYKLQEMGLLDEGDY